MPRDPRITSKMRDISFEVAIDNCPEAQSIQARIHEKNQEQAAACRDRERLEQRRAHLAEAQRLVGEAITSQQRRLAEMALPFVLEEVPLDEVKAVQAEIEDLRLQLELYTLATPILDRAINDAGGCARACGPAVLDLEEKRDALLEKTRERLARAMLA
jgi:hypothetical protein